MDVSEAVAEGSSENHEAIKRVTKFSEEALTFIDSYDEMYPDWEEKEKPVQVLDIQLVMRRTLLANSKSAEEKMSSGQKAEWLTESMSHLRLDRENIEVVENLECFSSKLTHLYLQHNRIRAISGLTCLENLKFLCLSHNRIEVLHTDEFPKNIIVMYLDGNACTKSMEYPHSVICALPKLKSLDCESVTDSQRRRAKAFFHPELGEDEKAGAGAGAGADVEESSGEESGDDNREDMMNSVFAQLSPEKQRILTELELGGQVDSVEELLTGDQLQVWRTSYQQVQVLSSSEEESNGDSSGGDEEAKGEPSKEAGDGGENKLGKKKSKKKGSDRGGTLKTDKEKKNLRQLGINPAHFRDLTVKLLGRSRARQQEDFEKHCKKQSKLDSYREEESARLSFRVPVSGRVVADKANKVKVTVLPE